MPVTVVQISAPLGPIALLKKLQKLIVGGLSCRMLSPWTIDLPEQA
jgi:hypothetical protein